MQLIPAIDLKDGRCVRLLEGRFDARTDYDVEPDALAARYVAAGAQWIHLVDLDGARDGRRANAALISRIAGTCGGRVQVGGGIRNEASLREVLDLGGGRAVLGSTAVEDMQTAIGWLGRFGPERIVLALDVRIDADGEPRPRTHGWTRCGEQTLWQLLEVYVSAGLRHLLCTDIARDGTLAGPNLGLYEEIRRRHPALQMQASGGVASIADLRSLAGAGIDAAISGKALLDGRITLEEARPFLPNA